MTISNEELGRIAKRDTAEGYDWYRSMAFNHADKMAHELLAARKALDEYRIVYENSPDDKNLKKISDKQFDVILDAHKKFAINAQAYLAEYGPKGGDAK